MNKNVKNISVFLVAITVALGLTGCTWDKEEAVATPTPTPHTEKEELSKKIKEMEEKAKKDVEDAKEVDKEDIDKAVTYINEHVNEPFKDKETAEKLAYYGSYLKHAGAKTTEGSKHELAKLGENVHIYVKGVYTKTEEETSKISTDLKNGIHTSLVNINKAKDHIIDEFHKMVK